MVKMIKKIVPKVKKEVVPKRYNQKVYNRIFMGGLVGFLLLSVLTMAVAIGSSSRKKEPVVTELETSVVDIDYRLQNWSSNFVYYYFSMSKDSIEQSKQLEKLSSYYAGSLDVRSQSYTRVESQLNSSKLLEVTDDVVTYLVSFTTNNSDEDKSETVVTEFNIPYGIKNDRYFVSDLPYFSNVEANQVEDLSDKEKSKLVVGDQLTDDEKKKYDSFLILFFENYVGKQENLDLLVSGVDVVSHTTFKSLDYSSFELKKDKVVAYVQVSFDSADFVRSENFTLILIEDGGSFKVESLKHGIDN